MVPPTMTAVSDYGGNFNGSNTLLRMLSTNQAPAFGFWNRIAEFFRGVEPEMNRFLCVCESRFLGISVRHERLIFFAPIDNRLVSIHQRSPAKWYFRMTARTCRAWYGLALLPSRCRLILSSIPCLRKM